MHGRGKNNDRRYGRYYAIIKHYRVGVGTYNSYFRKQVK